MYERESKYIVNLHEENQNGFQKQNLKCGDVTKYRHPCNVDIFLHTL
jgi:hypothetical protein